MCKLVILLAAMVPWLTTLESFAQVITIENVELKRENTQFGGPMLAISTCVALLLLVSGTYFFRRMEQTFADVV